MIASKNTFWYTHDPHFPSNASGCDLIWELPYCQGAKILNGTHGEATL